MNLLRSNYEDKILDNNQEVLRKVAYLANTCDPLFKKYHLLDRESWGRGNILGAFFVSLGEDFKTGEMIINTFKQNKYYNLPNLEVMIEYAKQFDSAGAPD